MKKIELLLTVLIFLLTGIPLCFAADMDIITPPDKALLENEIANIAIKVDGDSVDTIQLKINDFPYLKEKVDKDRGFFCSSIIVATGKNTLQVIGYKDGKQVAEKEIEVFLLSKILRQDKSEYEEFEKYSFHLPDKEKKCMPCHKLDIDPSYSHSGQPEESPCYTCHKAKIEQKYTHGPAAAWMCMVCHEVNENGPKYTITAVGETVCANCHDDAIEEWQNSKMMHGPVAVGQCALCHDPHSSEWPYMVRMHTTDLCIKCHSTKGTEKHVTFGFSRKGHPIRGVPDPTHPGKEFTCASCHNPHASDYVYFLRHKYKDNKGRYCMNCHMK